MVLLILILLILFLCSGYSEPYRLYIYIAIGVLVISAFVSGFIKGYKEQKTKKAKQEVLNAAKKAELETLNYQIVATKMAAKPTAPGAETRLGEAHEKWSDAMDELTAAVNKYNKINDS